MPLNAIIVDDEWLARKRLESLLLEQEDINIVAKCKNGKDALKEIKLRNPDLVFLDVQMPDMDGFEVLKNLKLKKIPEIIFTTAFDQYAIRAFEVEALDYLLKPFDEERLEEALKRVKRKLKLEKDSGFHHQLLQLVEQFQQAEGEHIYLLEIKHKGRSLKISTDEIYYIKSGGNYVTVHTKDKRYIYRSTMTFLEEKLPPNDYFRIHRSYILNEKFIDSWRYMNNNEFKFNLKNGISLVSGKSYKYAIASFLEK